MWLPGMVTAILGRVTEQQSTTDPFEIKEWARQRGGSPVLVPPGGHKAGTGRLSLTFPDDDLDDRPDEAVWPLLWPQWLAIFAEEGLVFYYRDREPNGQLSRSYRLYRSPMAPRGLGPRRSARSSDRPPQRVRGARGRLRTVVPPRRSA